MWYKVSRPTSKFASKLPIPTPPNAYAVHTNARFVIGPLRKIQKLIIAMDAVNAHTEIRTLCLGFAQKKKILCAKRKIKLP